MATHKSAIKRHKQSLKKRTANREKKAAMRTQLKKARTLVAAGEATIDHEEIKKAARHIVRLGQKGILHKKTAARRVSRLMLAANKSA